MNERHGGGFFQGFIFGLLIGAGLMFLFGTSKGKKVLQMLLDQVEENTQLSELLEMPEEDDEYMTGVEMDEGEPAKHEQEASKRPIAKVKRFFKGAPKKLVS